MLSVEELWYGDGAGARVWRTALAPASWLYGTIARARGHGIAVTASALPALSVGNMTVGGTGKTPVAAWATRQLIDRGAHPAVVLRGYGADEPLVHKTLNSNARVIVDVDRVRGVLRAKEGGADCAVLDDAFQHRQISRISDWVLFAAEQWSEDLRVLPGGPLREPLDGLARASVLVVTRKSATQQWSMHVGESLVARFPGIGLAHCYLRLDEVVDARSGVRFPVEWLRGRLLAVAAGVGAPAAFHAQLRESGAEIHVLNYRDHHAYSSDDISQLVRAADRTEGLVCTLKDAVKLAPYWPPAAPPLWYVSQSVTVESGAEVLDRGLEEVLAARQTSFSPPAQPASVPTNGY